MVFNSLEFLIFLPCVFLLYHIMPRRLRTPLMLLASYLFYAFHEPRLVFLLLFSTALSYLCARMISLSRGKAWRKIWLAAAVVGCLGLLVFFKYFNFLMRAAGSIAGLFGGDFSFSLDILLPAGISFYTFQTLSYVIDVYRGKLDPEKNFFVYALYVSFFPQLVAGPIERPDALIPQLKAEQRLSADDLEVGLIMILTGMFKKVCVADMLAIHVNKIFNAPEKASGVLVAAGSVLFAFQILCDFSGYSDIAVGCARLFGIKLTKNFDAPYSSASVREFWGRWHISLSSWLRDYIYIPLGGSRCRKPRQMFNILLVFLISGLWHGAAYTFIIWGLFHAVWQIGERLTAPLRDNIWKERAPRVRHALEVAVTFCAVCFSWIIFRANSLSELGSLVSRLFSDWELSAGYFKGAAEYLSLSPAWAVFLIISFAGLYAVRFLLPSKAVRTGKGAAAGRYMLCLTYIWMIFGCAIYLSSAGVESRFIYFQF